MPTFLFNEVIFGPVSSRRLGRSLGINLLPTTQKYCNYDCLYCECGLNQKLSNFSLISKTEIINALRNRLVDLKKKGETIDAITFAGNGEPTMHPEFCQIIEEVKTIGTEYLGIEIPIVVLSNATMLDKPDVVNALKKCGKPILKLDTAIENTFALLNRSNKKVTTNELITNLTQFKQVGIIQTMFLKGDIEGNKINNASEQELEALITAYKQIEPKEIMIYSIQRDTPVTGLQAFLPTELEEIAKKIAQAGLTVRAY